MLRILCRFLTIVLLLLSPTLSDGAPRTAFVHLFEWQWSDIAEECEDFLGPKGFAAVQVSPPQQSISGSEWWTRYQPMGYAIEGRSGSRAQFAEMVDRCKAVGVDIYVDAVINHMAALDRNFPEVPYGPDDFHTCTTPIDYSNTWSIQNCDLSGLNDLKTESAYVQGKIADYMNDLIGLGVAGFRIDAAKHIPADDINAIKSRLNGNPYIFQEVIYGAGEPVQPSQYTWISNVTEFHFSNTMGHYFKLRSPLSEIQNIGTWPGWLNSSDAVTFVANHDNQRQKTNDIITHKDGNNSNNMAHVFMLGWPYGYPKIMSSYDWSDHDQGPPTHGASSCNDGWLCEHRNRPIANMVAFRNNTATYWGVTNYWDNGNHQMAWGRGGLGFVVINMEGYNLNRNLQTGMPEGTYCDIIHADFDYNTGDCNGATVTVDGDGNASFDTLPYDSTAIHVGARVGVACPECGGNNSGEIENVDVLFTCDQGTTYMGQSVYVTGNHALLGNWNLANAVKLDSTNYPTWTGNVSLPDNQQIEWKCVKRDEQNPDAGIEWQAGGNNAFNTATNNTPWASFGGIN